MRIVINTCCLVVIMSFSSIFLRAEGEVKVDALKMEKKLKHLLDVSTELFTTERTYNQELDNLIRLEKKLIVPKGSLKLLFAGKEKKEKIEKQNELIEAEIKDLTGIKLMSSSLMDKFKDVKDLCTVPKDFIPLVAQQWAVGGLSWTTPNFIEFKRKDKDTGEEKTCLDVLDRIFTYMASNVNSPEGASRAYQRYSSLFMRNQDKENPISIEEFREDAEVSRLRILPIQRGPRYILILRGEYIPVLEYLATHLPKSGDYPRFKEGLLAQEKVVNKVLDRLRLIKKEFDLMVDGINEATPK